MRSRNGTERGLKSLRLLNKGPTANACRFIPVVRMKQSHICTFGADIY